MDNLIQSLKKDFKEKGFDIVEPFRVNEYNGAALHKLNNFEIEDATGIIIGCTKNFWKHFEEFIKRINEIPKDPMNSFVIDTIENVIKNNQKIQEYEHEIRYDFNTPASGKYVHIQTCGHFAGVAAYDQDVMWCVHPTYGLWFVFRSVVIIKINYEGKSPVLPPKDLLSDFDKSEMKKHTQIAIDEGWCNLETRLKIRDACPIGKELYRYEGDMFDYFYPLKRSSKSVLEAMLVNNSNSNGKSEEQKE
ncbi:hypothetical protein DICPUDRAFT_92412 [Dictyostelium purpureum]|uniref:Cyanocobalamin reductase (cyanide-eliminating) n=1 Tax=Dictyostelium purpureum TaxID=5786 RepID=F0ZRG5_DICPU|nr:uncharacterized protein DICPUDRAFT_92412 [Dictyostelium purpureum]EGC33486.1 hypothetical protein DICPUDRAFT_92412 [Dictyostelium purpureum]|eukprot:XP_003290009.1 hypothetical protein DICPUDRAFT_92412 [Dictyostelium purpureum]